MKKIILLFVITISFLLYGCHNIQDEIDSLNEGQAALAERIKTLEEWQKLVNGNIETLQGLVDALVNRDYISGVIPFYNPAPGGYVLIFEKSEPLTISNGTNGETPHIGVEEDNGRYFWTLNDSFIEIDNSKLPVTGNDGNTPQLRINSVSNFWQFSLDGGVLWTDILDNNNQPIPATGPQGDAIFAADGVDLSNPQYVVFTLANGETITIPKYQSLGIWFVQPEEFAAGTNIQMNYTVTGQAEIIKVLDIPNGWGIRIDKTNGYFDITAPNSPDTSLLQHEALVLISDEAGHTITRGLGLSILHVSFDLNPPTHPREVKIVFAPTTTVGALPEVPVKNGYYFTGWNMAVDGSGEWFTVATTVLESFIVYAQWMHIDVAIVGAGTAGMAAAYALKDSGYNVVLVEKENILGGTAVNAWVETWIAGINPPYLIKLFNLLKSQGEAWGDLNASWLPAKFAKPEYNDGQNLVRFDPAGLARQYETDMKNAGVIIEKRTCFIDVIMDSDNPRRVSGITVVDVDNPGNLHEITAKYFIDSTGDGILCRQAGSNAFLGEDPYDLYYEDFMQGKTPKQIINEPSLFFKLKQAPTSIPTREIANTNFNYDGYVDWHWVNPMTGFGISGMDVVNNGTDATYARAVSLIDDFWNFIKKEYQRRKEAGEPTYYTENDVKTIPSGQYAPMLGIRESYRIECEYMLRQSDLSKKINSADLQNYIACGSHDVDFHVYGSIDRASVQNFNKASLKPSGIPYECLIPEALDNVLVAGRAFGASHIALAARRVNKDMAQLGWAAGHTVRFCLENELTDTREADVKALQSAEYTGFVDSVKELEIRMK